MKMLAVALVLLPTSALAQQGPPTEQQLLGQTIGNLFVENARLAIELQKAQNELRALKEKASTAPLPAPDPGGK